jgi:DNA polymerase-3 subunit alpha
MHGEGLVCIIPSFSSDVAQAIKNSDLEKARESIDFYKKAFGIENVFVEITKHPEIDGHDANMRTFADFAKSTNTPIVAAHDVYYLHPDDKVARDTLMLVNTSGDFGDRGISSGMGDDEEEDFSFISPERAEELFKDMPEAIENTNKVVEMCNLKIELGKWVFPAIDLPEGATADDELRRIAYEGFDRRNVEKTPDRIARVDYELSVIKNKGYAPYFLVVADLLRFGHEHGILSNIRGSVSGSMATYLSGITNIDPIEYEIPFERFLNPDRPSAPDIDMDFADDRRDEMVEYARKKYGHDKVAQIGTFGTMAARGSVRDVTRALGFPYDLGDRIAKLIPMGSQGFPMTIERALEESPDLKKLHDENPDVKRIIATAKKIEGCARHISIHAAGVVMSPTNLTDFTPLQYDPKGEKKIISQYDMYSIEEAGLLKFDFLGLKNLSIIADALKHIKRNYGKELTPDTIPIDDKKTFEMLARGETADLFQLNGEGMTKYLIDLKPTSIHDINAMVALYRPGPIQFIPDYIARKHDRTLIKYLDPALEPILQKTYGILVYQDDLLMMAHKLAGYSWGEVDKFRKAVGKKIPEEMAQQKEKFIEGCIKHSKWPEKKAKQIWTWIEPFAAYGFNKAHSVSYGRVAYQTAYLKANYPGEYMTAVLAAEAGDVDKVAESITECVRLKTPVLPPDINESFAQFTLIKDGGDRIRFGLISIKNFGQGIADAIIVERKKGGKFKSLADFLDRVRDRNLNKKSLESLIKAGALDCFNVERGLMLANIETIIAYNKEREKHPDSQDSLFGLMSDTSTLPTLKLSPSKPAKPEEKLAWEKELLGMYISGHPLDKYRAVIAKRDMNIKKAVETLAADKEVTLACIIEEIRQVTTKNNEQMAFIRCADFTGGIEAVAFPRTFRELKNLLINDKAVVFKGKISERNGEKSIIIDRAMELK